MQNFGLLLSLRGAFLRKFCAKANNGVKETEIEFSYLGVKGFFFDDINLYEVKPKKLNSDCCQNFLHELHL